MEENKDSVQDILKELLNKDINLLSSRDGLYNQLDEKVPGRYRRELAPIQKAIQNNIGELFLKAQMDNTDESRNDAKEKAAEILRQNNIQERTIQKVINTFVYALDWKKTEQKSEEENPVSVAQDTEMTAAVRQDIKAPDDVQSESDKKSNQLWTCSCGKLNDKKFCIACGKPRPLDEQTEENLENKPIEWNCPVCGNLNTGKFCYHCGHAYGEKAASIDEAENKTQALSVDLGNAAEIKPAESAIANPADIQTKYQPSPAYEQTSDEQYNQPGQPNDSSYNSTNPHNSSAANPGKSMLLGAIVGLVIVFAVIIGIKAMSSNNDESENVATSANTEVVQPSDSSNSANKKAPVVDSDLSLGGLALGYTVDQMHDILGKENSSKQKGRYMFYYYDDIQVGVKDGKIDALVSENSSAETKRGIHQGSALQDVFYKYGTDYIKMDYNDLFLYEYTFTAITGKQGIMRFAVNKSDNHVQYISVRIPEEETAKYSSTNNNQYVYVTEDSSSTWYVDSDSCTLEESDEHSELISFNLIMVPKNSKEENVNKCYVRGYDGLKSYRFDNETTWNNIRTNSTVSMANRVAMDILGLES